MTHEVTSLRRDDVRSVIIIGSGPAGLTAALYTARATLKPLVFEGDGFFDTMPGGQLTITTEVENFPGLVRWEDGKLRGMTGPEIVDLIRRQAMYFGAECVGKRVTSVDFSRRPLRVECDGEVFHAEAVIVATGASARWLGLPSEEEYKNFGVSACATCDGALYRDKDVVVVGGGDTAVEEALFLTRHCRSVTIVHRRDQLRASKIMAERAMKNPKIRFEWNAQVVEILGRTEGMRKFVTGVRLRDTKTGEERVLACDGVFIAIGHTPNTSIFRGQLEMDEQGYIVMQGRSTYTSARGVFAAGDCADHVYRQAITAAGTGCMAAIDAERFIQANPIEFAG
jgi:thioredoxin reductase (NADPH)